MKTHVMRLFNVRLPISIATLIVGGVLFFTWFANDSDATTIDATSWNTPGGASYQNGDLQTSETVWAEGQSGYGVQVTCVLSLNDCWSKSGGRVTLHDESSAHKNWVGQAATLAHFIIP